MPRYPGLRWNADFFVVLYTGKDDPERMKNLYPLQLLILLPLVAGAPLIVTAQQTDLAPLLSPTEDPAPSSGEPAMESGDGMADPASEADAAESEIDPQIEQTIKRYASEVQRLESESGAYNNDLVEQLIGLGLAYSDAEKHAEALKIYQRALHINRVNHGLHSLDQIPILERVIESNTAMKDYNQLNNNYSYMLWVYKRNYPENDLRMLPVLDRIAEWHLDAFNKTLVPESLGHLVVAANLYNESLEIIKLVEGDDHPDMIRPLYGIVNANFKLIEPRGYIEGIDMIIGASGMLLLPSNFTQNSTNDEFRSTFLQQNYGGDYLARVLDVEKDSVSLVQNSYRSGRAALEKIVDIHVKHPDLPRRSYAYALAQTGDWFQRFSKRDASTNYYRQAYTLLSGAGAQPAELDELFGKPISLDALNVPRMMAASLSALSLDTAPPRAIEGVDMSEKTDLELQELATTGLKDTAYVVVQFDVTASGIVRNLEFIVTNPEEEDSRLRRMARERINITPFRPRLENGQPIATEDVKMVYTFQE